jgi:preprotein translocase subunit SecG
MTILINALLAIWGLDALLMLLVILMQRPKSEGLGAAFGGGVTENIFGAQTTNVLVKFTAWLAGIFFVLTFALSILYAKKTSGDSALRRELLKQQAGATASPAPAPTAAQPSPVSSPAPDSGVGVVPAGSVTPAPTAPLAETSVTPAAEQSAAPTASPRATSKRKRKP